MKETALLDRRSALTAALLSVGSAYSWIATIALTRRRQMRDILRERMLRADRGDSDIRGFACFGERIVTGIKVFAFLVPPCLE